MIFNKEKGTLKIFFQTKPNNYLTSVNPRIRIFFIIFSILRGRCIVFGVTLQGVREQVIRG